MKKFNLIFLYALIFNCIIPNQNSFAEEKDNNDEVLYDTMTVTATREARPSKEVPEAIAVISRERLDQTRGINISETLRGIPGLYVEPTSGGFSTRVIIRGAGLKANFGVREIMLLRDGVPLTEPDSFSRLDSLDLSDVDRIEVTKSPGNLYATASAGGTIQIISKSPFDPSGDGLRIGYGEHDTGSLHLRKSFVIDEEHAFAFTGTHKETNNNWRFQNNFKTDQLSLKYGWQPTGDITWNSEFQYIYTGLQIPPSMDQGAFDEFKRTGKQKKNQGGFTPPLPFQDSGRYSDTYAFNTRLEWNMGDLVFLPRFYWTHFNHRHPIVGGISDIPGNNIFGTDLEFKYNHSLMGDSTLVAGLTLRQDRSIGTKNFQYKNVLNDGSGRIIDVLDDEAGPLREEDDTVGTVYGIFAQETLRPTDKLTVDLSFRFDHVNIDTELKKYTEFNFAPFGAPGSGPRTWVPVVDDPLTPEDERFPEFDENFDLFAPRLGLTYELTETINAYGLIAQAEQVPFSNELEDNRKLESATVRTAEVGFKGRSELWKFDTSLYYTETKDEVIGILVNGDTQFQNAGETEKLGVEIQGDYTLSGRFGNLTLGAAYSYTDYEFIEFSAVVSGVNVDFSGKSFQYIPDNQYSLYAEYNTDKFTLRLQTYTWDEYYIDNNNSDTYSGYDFLTSLFAEYKWDKHSISVTVDNLFDKRYASRVQNGSSVSYTAGEPRVVFASYRYNF